MILASILSPAAAIELVVEIILLGTVSVIIRNYLSGLNDKIEKVLNNQQSQEVAIAEIKKDVESAIDLTKQTRESASKNTNDIQTLSVKVAEVLQWKRDTERSV